MKNNLLIALAFLPLVKTLAQNDLDAIRYSQITVGGNARFISMGGAFGALGANTSCLSYNPAGLGIYRKGEANGSLKLLTTGISSLHNDSSANSFKASSNFFNGFGAAISHEDKQNADVRHSFGVANNQLQNYNSSISIVGYGRGKSIINDFLNEANGTPINNLNPFYSGMAYSALLIDTMNGNSNYYGFIDPSVNMLQSKKIDTKGYMNELVFGYTYAKQDKYYFGASLGLPRVTYTYEAVYTESDNRDQSRIYKDASNNPQSTYPFPVYLYYTDNTYTKYLGGINSMSYSEAYRTSGSGYNLKLGFLYRATEFLRLGAYFHSPTVLKLKDVYSYSVTTNWDSNVSYSAAYPTNGGYFNYKIYTPMRVGTSVAYIYEKLLSIGLDYENVNYRQASLASTNPADFAGVNKTIKTKYKSASNIRAGAEVNFQQVFFRLGYAMYGSPFGKMFSGPFVRNSFSTGFGFKSDKWTFDIALVKTYYKEDYYMYNPVYVDKSSLSFSGTNFVITIGCKF